jgi:hypothetical protein
MRVWIGFVVAVALVVAPVGAKAEEAAGTSGASAAHAKHRLPPQLMLRTTYFLYLDAGADTEASEVPDIDTLSQRAIENYEIQSAQSYAQRGKQGSTGERSRGAKAGIAVGVVLGVGLVCFGIGAAVAVSNSFNDL